MSPGLLGRFITLEGGEGAGKSTLINALAKRARENDISAETTREPGGTPLAEAVRNLVLQPPNGHSWTPMAEALMMNAARSEHLDRRIRPALEKGQWVFCDRFSDSTLAYQSAGGGVSMSTLLSMEAAVLECSRPDLTIILDAAPEDLRKRVASRGDPTDAFEQRPLKFHQDVRAAFLQIAKRWPERCVVLDAMKSPDRLLEEAWAAIEARCLAGAGRA
ncbi:MAG: dTMP kinase [Pseudomonadota bacterium]